MVVALRSYPSKRLSIDRKKKLRSLRLALVDATRSLPCVRHPLLYFFSQPSKATTKVTQQPLQPGQSKPSPSPSTAFGPATPEPKIVVTSIISKPLQLTECLRLFGAVLSLLRLTLVLLGRRPLGRRLKDGNPAPRLFRRLCSLLEFLEGAREMRSSFLRRETGGGGGMATGRGGGLFGRSSHVRYTKRSH